MLRINACEFGEELSVEALSRSKEIYLTKNVSGATGVLSVARKNTSEYERQEEYLKESKYIWVRTVEQDCYSERYVLHPYECINDILNSFEEHSISISWTTKEYALSLLNPNCCFSRFDICYPCGVNWIIIQNGEDSFAVGYHEVGNRAWIGTLRVPLKPMELNELVAFIFRERKSVERISFRVTRCNPYMAWPNVKAEESSFFYLLLPDTISELMSSMHKKFRYNLKRERRILDQVTDGVSVICTTVDEVPDEVMNAYFGFKAKKYLEDYLNFTKENYLQRQQNTATHVYTLVTKRGDILAAVLTAELNNVANLVNMAYNDGWRLYSPGKCLYFEVIKMLINKGIRSFYLGSGAYEYKHYFCAKETQYWVGDFLRNK